MELILKRTRKGQGYTEGELYVMCAPKFVPEFFCNTIEPEWRNLRHGGEKVMGRTAIPEGRYRIELDASPKWRRLMPYLVNVPGFTGVQIHPGNSSADTEGCILVGEKIQADMIISSRTHFTDLYNMIEAAVLEGELVTITIV